MSSDLQVPFQTRKPGARRYTNFIVRNHYILAPGRETVRETSKSCVSRSNRESWEAWYTHVNIVALAFPGAVNDAIAPILHSSLLHTSPGTARGQGSNIL